MNLVTSTPYERRDEYEKALTGKTSSEGGILPDDNVSVYIPIDLSTESIMRQLHILYRDLGIPTESNEFQYDLEVRKLISQLEIYDQVWGARIKNKFVISKDSVEQNVDRLILEYHLDKLN